MVPVDTGRKDDQDHGNGSHDGDVNAQGDVFHLLHATRWVRLDDLLRKLCSNQCGFVPSDGDNDCSSDMDPGASGDALGTTKGLDYTMGAHTIPCDKSVRCEPKSLWRQLLDVAREADFVRVLRLGALTLVRRCQSFLWQCV